MNEARIKLAEVMGWTKVKPYRNGIYGLPPGTRAGDDALWLEFCLNIPNPETDANDDYAVLEWMRDREDVESYGGHPYWELMDNNLRSAAVDYELGDYGRAACKVLDIPLTVEDSGS